MKLKPYDTVKLKPKEPQKALFTQRSMTVSQAWNHYLKHNPDGYRIFYVQYTYNGTKRTKAMPDIEISTSDIWANA